MTADNLLSEIPADLPDELVNTIIESDSFRIERIVSQGHASPEGFWYDQDDKEWVVVLKGEAKLLFEGDEQSIHMMPGDHINIPSHKRHRVEWTRPDEPTIWLAVHYG